jgi:transcription elongation factor GreB
MPRYRAPRPESSKYITPEGAAALRRELDELWRVKRPAVTRAVSEAAAQGDRSENAEYIYGRKKLREIDRRLRELDGKITRATVVSGPRRDDRIYLGARVTLEKKGGGAMVVSLVGDDEIDPAAGRISRNSPLGAALLGREPFGTFGIETPRGPQEYKILSVEY